SVASDNRLVRLWDVTTGESIRDFIGHFAAVTAVAYGPDGKTLASAAYQDTVRLWDVATGKTIHSFNQGSVRYLTYAPDGKTLAAGGKDDNVRVWDVTSGKMIHLFSCKGGPKSLLFAPNGRTLAAAGGYDQSVRLWDMNTGKPIHNEHHTQFASL